MVSLRKPLDRPATYADLEALPGSVKGEIIDGQMYVQPKPRRRHATAAGAIFGSLAGRPGPGGYNPEGWIVLIEPGIELPGAPEVGPDLAGWRAERLVGTDPDAPLQVVPDWVCEVLSPSNYQYDRKVKFPFYARVGVQHLWVVNPRMRTVEIKRLANERWVDLAVFAENETMRTEPFENVEIPLGLLWLP